MSMFSKSLHTEMNAMERSLSLRNLRDGISDNIIERISDPKDRILVSLLYKVCNRMDPSRMQFVRFSILLHQHGVLNDLNFLTHNAPSKHMIAHHFGDPDLSDDAWNEWSEEESIDNEVKDLNLKQSENDATAPDNHMSHSMPLMLCNKSDISMLSLSTPTTMHQLMSRYQRDFEELECIGYGAFGVVHLCKHRLDSMHYAIKKIIYKHKPHNHEERKKEIIRECTNIATLNHQNIVRYFTAWIEPISYKQTPSHIDNHKKEELSVMLSPCRSQECSPMPPMTKDRIFNYWQNQTFHSCLYLQTEYCGSYSLKDFINEKDRKPNTDDNMHLFSQILLGLAHIHSKFVLHRDLKPENVFLVNADGNNQHDNISKLTPKIGDFGLSKSLIDRECIDDLNELHKFHFQHSNMSNLTKNTGTGVYASPEQLQSRSYGTAADIYSLGIILFELIQPAFETQMERCIAISNFRNHQQIDEDRIDRPRLEKEIDLMMRMTDIDPSKRPTAHSLILEEFIQIYWMRNVLNAAIPSMSASKDHIVLKDVSNGMTTEKQ